MVPSPRKRASAASFDQTWDETNAALFDPSSLPIARIPRGWERKQETKKTEKGREKKIWRRFNLRSRASDTTEEEEGQGQDARVRPVKKLQHLSPKAMEKTTAKPNGKKCTFKATRWDRRKSVLPRKKTTRSQDSARHGADDADDSDDPRDATHEDLSQESLTDVEPAVSIDVDTMQNVMPEGKDRRGTFTFIMDTDGEPVDEVPEHEGHSMLDDRMGAPEDFTEAEDATIAQLFRSPSKQATAQPVETSLEVEYPELPLSDRDEDASETLPESIEVEDVVNTAAPTEGRPKSAREAEFQDDKKKVEEQEMLPQGLEAQEIEVIQGPPAVTTPTMRHTSFQERAVLYTGDSTELLYPALPAEALLSDPIEPRSSARGRSQLEITNQDAEMLEATIYTNADHDEQEEREALKGVELDHDEEESADEDFTEASLQLNILRDYQDTLRGKQLIQTDATEQSLEEDTEDQDDIGSTAHGEDATIAETSEESSQSHQRNTLTQSPVKTHVEDITNGLTLSFTLARATSAEPTPRKLQSPPSFPVQSAAEDATTIIAVDDDTALLKDFLNRAAASKAEKAAVMTHRRESLKNRRDSDVIRHALASPRKVLEDKDPNSPSKHDNELTLDLSQPLTLDMGNDTLQSPTWKQADDESAAEEKSLRGSRRSSRAKKSRLPAPASAAPAPTQAQASKISIRRADGTEHVVLKKSDAQELATLTRANTRKNKQGAFGVTVRLMKIALDAVNLPPLDESTKEPVVGKNIRWDEQLAYYQENPETVAEAESLATPDELGMPDPVSTPSAKPKSKISKNSTPKIRRVRGLGTANGTPGKDLLAPVSLLPDDVRVEEEAAQTLNSQLAKPKASKGKKISVASSATASVSTPSVSKLPSLDIVPVGVEPTKERKSRLAAPKKVMLPQPIAPHRVEGKENAQRSGISGATPRKGIPAPKVVVPPTVGMESGLPRRRGRRI